jgi:glutamyl-tRNA synthetase
LHLGNARTFLCAWALARSRGWRVLLRIEDLDTPRTKPGAVEQAIGLLRWLGMDWDEGPVTQSDDLGPYREAMARLAVAGRVYPCALTRAEVDAAMSAPHEGDERVSRASAATRPAAVPRVFDDAGTNWRFVVEPGVVRFEDRFSGPHAIDVAGEAGDFVVWTKRGQPAYQLAVVVDDARQGVSEVVRGDDLLGSAARQRLLWRALEFGEPPAQTHLPLVRGEDGRRLAKRHGDTRLAAYREAGVPADAVVGLVAHWSGLLEAPEPMTARAFCEGFGLDTMPRVDVTFTAEHDEWLRSQVSGGV